MKNLQETWKDLGKYFSVNKALELGFSNGNYTKMLADYAKNVDAIDVSEDFMKIAKENLKDYNNIELKIMDARKLDYPDKSFDLVLSTSFHEFDLSGKEYKVDLDLKKEILKEMVRVSNCILFVEPTENAVTNELFKVFNPVENHADRIGKSNELIETYLQEQGYKLVDKGLTFNRDEFENREQLEEEMLNWWADIKVPADTNEKQEMIKQIDEILDKAGMLSELQVTEEIAYRVFIKE